MKRIAVVAVAAAGALVARRRLKAQQAEQELWAELTDSPASPDDARA
ncbi:DLW-39 family protein [Agilicoccus flavus]|nr:DLW-39 family protein [Agilicoccus flavus]